jgi:hypothetical protein
LLTAIYGGLAWMTGIEEWNLDPDEGREYAKACYGVQQRYFPTVSIPGGELAQLGKVLAQVHFRRFAYFKTPEFQEKRARQRGGDVPPQPGDGAPMQAPSSPPSSPQPPPIREPTSEIGQTMNIPGIGVVPGDVLTAH